MRPRGLLIEGVTPGDLGLREAEGEIRGKTELILIRYSKSPAKSLVALAGRLRDNRPQKINLLPGGTS
jgi:hypothetical protein